MVHKRYKCLLIIFTALLATSLFSAVHGTKYYRNTNYYLSIPGNNVFLNFDEIRTFDDFFPDNGTGTLFFDLLDTYTISSLMFSGTDCNVTITELGETNKLYVADVVAGSDSTVNFTLGYNLPYVQVVEGNITAVEVYPTDNNRLTWLLTGDGPTIVKIPCEGHTVYYLKTNGVTKLEGDSWSRSGNIVTVTDTLGSTHDYELSFSGGYNPPSPSSPDDDDPVEYVHDVLDAGASFIEKYLWLIVLIVVCVFVGIAVLFTIKKRSE